MPKYRLYREGDLRPQSQNHQPDARDLRKKLVPVDAHLNIPDNSHAGISGSPTLDAYKLDVTHLWRIELGVNNREGEHFTQFMVYDLDGGGRAEVACKTADGTKDGGGNIIGDKTKDYRNKDRGDKRYGRILDGF